MKLSLSVTRRILDLVMRKTLCKRPADLIIGGKENPYMHRWYVIPRNRLFNIYFHYFVRSDDDRALHTHPWWNLSLLLEGSYNEIVPTRAHEPAGEMRTLRREVGDLVFRTTSTAHRVELIERSPVATLFLTGPKITSWGFWCRKGFVPWQVFTKPGHPGEIGIGCGED